MSFGRRRLPAATVWLLSAAGSLTLLGQDLVPSQPSPQRPSFRAGASYVRVDVTATDRSGTPILDLTKNDFEITEAGVRQTIDAFRVVMLDGGLLATGDTPLPIRSDANEATEAARDDVRLFGMLLDDYHVKRTSSLWVREQLARFVETALGPSDMVGLMYPLDPISTVRLSRDQDALRRALLQFQGRKYDYSPLNEIERRYVFKISAEEIERTRNQVSFGALKSLILHLGALKEGRKSLILVSEGYANTLPLPMQTYYGGLGSGVVPSGSASPPPVMSVPDSRTFFSSMDIDMDMREIVDLANRNNVSLYPLDPRGLSLAEFGGDLPEVDRTTDRTYLGMTMNTLRVLAENSDGRALVNRNDLTRAMKQVVTDASAYYLLGYNSTAASPDGKFHEIRVKVKRPGVELRHRRGYWALKPEEAALSTSASAAAPGPIEAAFAAASVPPDRLIRTWTGIRRDDDGAARVMFVWEAAGASGGARPARVVVAAIGADGVIRFRGRVPETVALSSGGGQVSFEAGPGVTEMRLTIEAANGDVLDSETRTIAVPEWPPVRTALGTPEIFRVRTAAELERLKQERQPVPSAARTFSRTERLLVRVPVYGSAPAPAAARARLVNRAGQAIADLPIVRHADGEGFDTEALLANLPAGDYAIVVTAGDDLAAGETVAFHVTPN